MSASHTGGELSETAPVRSGRPSPVDSQRLAAARAREAQSERLKAQAVGKFARAFHVLLRASRLYQKNHPQLLESMERAEQTLREALEWASPLALRVGRGTMAPHSASASEGGALADARGELKALADELSRCGVQALSFQKETNLGELHSLCILLKSVAHSAARSENNVPTGAEWARLLELNHINAIRVNAPAEETKAGTSLAGLLAAFLKVALTIDPATLRAGAESSRAPAGADEPAVFEELLGELRLLNRLAGALRESSPASGPRAGLPGVRTPEETAEVMRKCISDSDRRAVTLLISAFEQQAPQEQEQLEPFLSRLAEGMILEHVMSCFRDGPSTVSEVQARIERIAREVAMGGELYPGASLSSASGARKLPNGGLWTEEGFAEHLQECFWEELEEQEKSKLLRGHDAWHVPVTSLKAHLQGLCNTGQDREARHIFLNFAQGLGSREIGVRRVVAAALSEMGALVDACWPAFVPEDLSRSVVRALLQEAAPDVLAILSSVTAALAKLAVRKCDFAELEQILSALEPVSPPTGAAALPEGSHLETLRLRILAEPNWTALLEAALVNPPHSGVLDVALTRILARDPTRVLDDLTARLGPEAEDRDPRTHGLTALPAMTRLLRAIGEPAFGALVTQLFDPRAPQAVHAGAAVKLLSAAKPERLVEVLPRAVGSWEWNLQDMAVSELIRIRPAGLSAALLEALGAAHPLVVPMMLDELGVSREVAALPVLLDIAAGHHDRLHDVFVRIKAVEALGRMGVAGARQQAADVLRTILRRREGLMHVEPAGLRTAAEEALGLIENRPSSARVRASSQALEKTSQPFTRPRRYMRFPVSPPLTARVLPTGATTTVSPAGASAEVNSISLGGAFIASGQRFSIGDALNVEIRAGMRSIQSMAVVRNVSPQGGGVEFVHMKQDDREKLRKFISKLSKD